MKIEFTLKYDDMDDLSDPYGHFVITDGRAVISEPDTFLYGWFDSLITGLRELREGKSSIGFVGEPNKLVLLPKNGGAEIAYRDITVGVGSLDELERAIREAARNLIKNLHTIGIPQSNSFLDNISSFVDQE